MKNIEKLILSLITIIFIGGIFTACTAQSTVTIRATTLGELMKSNNEIECFAHLYDTDSLLVKESLDSFRTVFKKQVMSKGWTVKQPDTNLIYQVVPFDRLGNIIPYNTFKKEMHIDNDTEEKTLFHYPIED